jgi:TPR repeat protein
MYQHGFGVPQDYVQAVEWYQKAAEHGFAEAENNLAVSYLHGWGVSQDLSQHIKLLSMAADKGEVSAQHNLGEAYFRPGSD